MPGIFDDNQALQALYETPVDPAAEPIADFPLSYYEDFLREIKRLGIEVITYRGLFEGSDDWDYKSHYKREFAHWTRKVRDPSKTYLVIQHDVDNHPDFTRRMIAMEAVHGIRSNIFIFRERYSRTNANPSYDVDHEFLSQAEAAGFVIGYHQNAFVLAGFDLDAAVDRYRADMVHLRRQYAIDFVVPHGGVGAEIDGRPVHNKDVPMPGEFEGNLRWVFNGFGVRFGTRWSDGGLRKSRDRQRLANLDIIGSFLHALKPGTRNFCLVHPQRWGFNVDAHQNPMLAEQPWYRDVIARYAGCRLSAVGSRPEHRGAAEEAESR